MNTHVVALVHEGDLHGVSRDRSGERQNKGSEELHFEAFVNECWSERMGVWGERNPRVSNETGGGGEKGRGILNVGICGHKLYARDENICRRSHRGIFGSRPRVMLLRWRRQAPRQARPRSRLST